MNGRRMAGRLLRPIVVLAVVAAVPSCGLKAKLKTKLDGQAQSQTKLGTHRIVVKPGSKSTSSSVSMSGGKAVYKYTSGDVTVVIRDNELVVNGKPHGNLKKGDSILIDNGQVKVNLGIVDDEPVPEEKTAARTPAVEQTPETRKKLAGYQVIVRPGSSSTATAAVGDQRILRVGSRTISIDNNELTVDKKRYGSLKHGDTILIQRDEVHVSGEKRLPQ